MISQLEILIAIGYAALFFSFGVLFANCINRCCREIPKPHQKERERIKAHQNKSTLVIKDGTPANDETQVQYFATGKGFVNGQDYHN